MKDYYTVIVQYPHQLRLEGTPEFYVAFVEADNAKKAILAGRREAWSRQAPRNRGLLSQWKSLIVLDRWACVQTPDSGPEWLSPWR